MLGRDVCANQSQTFLSSKSLKLKCCKSSVPMEFLQAVLQHFSYRHNPFLMLASYLVLEYVPTVAKKLNQALWGSVVLRAYLLEKYLQSMRKVAFFITFG